ncbi:MAG: PepSY domain-containing protein [Pseudomonadota bacterium]
MTETADTAPDHSGALYRTIWRWHFYAGLICLPFFVLLATTGALYLFRNELNLVFEHHLLVVEQSVGARALPAETLVARALEAAPGEAASFTPPPATGRSAQVMVRDSAEQLISVFLDPATGLVLGHVPEASRLMPTISHIHSLVILGGGPNLIIEVVGGWAILLVLSGVFLWWPRGRKGGVVTVRGSPARRVWWRDVHAVTGLFVCAVLLFLAVSGMPWSGFWGQRMGQLVDSIGLGTPAAVSPAAFASQSLGAIAPGSWTLDRSAAPTTVAAGAPLPIAFAVDKARALRLPPGYVVRLPAGADGVYTLQSYPDDATRQRVVHLDQYSGKVLADVGYGDYGPVAKATEWGIAVHMGRQYGLANQLILLTGCIGIVALSVTGAVMWWKRRPAGRLGAPPAPPRKRWISAFAVVALAIGALFPLLGLSILAALIIDRLTPRALKLKLFL